MSKSRFGKHLVLLSLLATGAACSGTLGSDGSFVLQATDDDGGNGSGGSTGSGEFNPATGSGGGFEECAATEEEATFIPVNMFIAVDKSGSMDNDNKWSNAKSAFNAFFTDPEADGLNVALRFWPDQGCEPDSCSTEVCSQPQVPLGSLAESTHEQALISTFNSKSPDGLTPMSAALAGATSWALDQQTANEGKEKTVVILLTDGEPTACDENINNIAQHAANAFNQGEILTFAVGLKGSNEGDMNIVAQAGGTQTGFFIGNGNTEQELIAALKAIQESAVACTFAMPESSDPDSPVDPNKVNVKYTPGDGGEDTNLPQVTNADACGAEGGWYYDDPDDPAIIQLCDSTCNAVQSDEAAKISIVLGCSTITT